MDLQNNNESIKPIVLISTRTLLILDLNGFLIDREYSKLIKGVVPQSPPEGAVRSGSFFVWMRPGIKEFLDIIFHNFDVAVWSSVSKLNIDTLSVLVFGDRIKQLKFIWDQNMCVKEPHPLTTRKPLFLKNLSKVWEVFPQYNESNTLIVDDTDLKMKNNPKECVVKALEWTHDDIHLRLDISRGVMRKLAYYILMPRKK